MPDPTHMPPNQPASQLTLAARDARFPTLARLAAVLRADHTTLPYVTVAIDPALTLLIHEAVDAFELLGSYRPRAGRRLLEDLRQRTNTHVWDVLQKAGTDGLTSDALVAQVQAHPEMAPQSDDRILGALSGFSRAKRVVRHGDRWVIRSPEVAMASLRPE